MARHLKQVWITAAVSTVALAAIALSSACDSGSSVNQNGGMAGSTGTGGTAATAGSSSTAGTTATAGTSSSAGGAAAGSTAVGGAGASNGGTSSGGASSGGAGSGGASGGGASGGGSAGSGAAGGSSVGGMRVPGTNGYDCTPPSGTVPALKATAVVSSGLSQPIELAHAPNDERLFVVERAGAVRIIKAGALVTKPFLDIKSKVIAGSANGDERGMLGLAFHPSYATNGLFYVHYSDKADPNDTGDTIIEEYKVSSASADEADAASARLVLRVEQPNNSSNLFRNHKGGAINFGADGFLYIGLGDGGGSGDTDSSHGTGNGQNLSSLLGKMLRIDPVKAANTAYSSPPGNLKDKMASAAPEIWDYGLRNPFRSGFDGCTGDLYIGDVGQDKWEEVDIEKVGDGNKNYGWNKTEGNHCYQPATGCDEAGVTKPAVEHDRTAGKSITGGAVYRGKSIPALKGAYIYADYSTNNKWSLIYDRDKGTASTPKSLTQDLNNVTSIVAIRNGSDGEVYMVSLMGGVYKLGAAE